MQAQNEQNNPKVEAFNRVKKAYFAARLPESYWKTSLTELDFRRCAVDIVGSGTKEWTPAKQRSELERVAKNPRGQLICIGSKPYEEAAFAAACWMLRELLHSFDCKKRVGAVNAAWLGNGGFADVVTSDEVRDHYKREHLPAHAGGYAIYNTTVDSDNTHCQGVRNLLEEYSSPIRIVVVAGCSDPYDFCRGRLHLRPDVCCYLRG